MDRLIELNRPSYHVYLVGGEVTYHPKFLELCEYMFQKFEGRLESFTITTNGSQKLEFFSKLLSKNLLF